MLETDKRQHIVDIARTWLGTPYHTMGRIKGVGADCLTLLAEIYQEAGIIPQIDIPYYPHDWHLHRGRERYLEGLLAYTREVNAPEPADIVLWKFGRCFSHGALVVKWPQIIHAYAGRSCVLENAEQATWLTHVGEHSQLRPVRFFTAL